MCFSVVCTVAYVADGTFGCRKMMVVGVNFSCLSRVLTRTYKSVRIFFLSLCDFVWLLVDTRGIVQGSTIVWVMQRDVWIVYVPQSPNSFLFQQSLNQEVGNYFYSGTGWAILKCLQAGEPHDKNYLTSQVAHFCVVISPAVGYLFLRTFKYVRDFNFNLSVFLLIFTMQYLGQFFVIKLWNSHDWKTHISDNVYANFHFFSPYI
jgi:hypothetical protein